MEAATGSSCDAPARLSRGRLTRSLSAIALAAGITAVAPGCGAPQNLAQAAEVLQTTLAGMPGVSDAWVYHDESYDQGVAVNIAVDVSNATGEQIAAVADRIDATRFGLIANYAQNVEFWVTQNRAVTLQRHSQLDPTQIADDSQRLRQIAAVTDGRIDWFRSDDGSVNQLAFNQSTSPGTAILDAVRSAAAGSGLSVSVTPAAASRRTPQMLVTFPLDAAEQASVFGVVDSFPTDVVGLRLDAAGLQALEVVAPDPGTAEQDLSKVITASEAVSGRPMWLAWYFPTIAGASPAYGGVVKIGGCSQAPAATIQTVADRGTGSDVSSLQARLQSQIDSCGAPASQPAQSQTAPSRSPTQVQRGTTPVIDVVTPSRVRGASQPAGLPSAAAQAPCASGAAGCAGTSTVAAGTGRTSNGSAPPRPVITPPAIDLGIPGLPPARPAAGGSGSGSGSGAGSGTDARTPSKSAAHRPNH